MSGTISTFVGDGAGRTFAGAVYSQVLQTSGVTGNEIANGSVTDEKLANMPAGTVKANTAETPGPPSNMLFSTLLGMLDVAAAGVSVAPIAGAPGATVQAVLEAVGAALAVGFGMAGGGGLPVRVPQNVLYTVGGLLQAPAPLPIKVDGTVRLDGTVVFLPGARRSAPRVPTRVRPGRLYRLPADEQAVAALPIKVDGTARVDGTAIFLVVP